MTGDQAAAPADPTGPRVVWLSDGRQAEQAVAPPAPARRQTRPGLPEPLVGCLLAAAASALVALAGAAAFILILTY